MDDIEKLLGDFSDRDPEWEWNWADRHQLEYALTWKTLEAYLPPAPCRVLGYGGPGSYAIELASRGYRVTLLDPAIRNLELVHHKAFQAGIELENAIEGSPLDLSRFEDKEFDAVLLMDGFFHIQEQGNYQRMLHESHRVLRPGGSMLSAFASRFAVLCDLSMRSPETVLDDASLIHSILEMGQPPENGNPRHELIADLVHPGEAVEQLWQAGLEVCQVIALGGLVRQIGHELSQTPGENFARWVDLNYRIVQDPHIWGGAKYTLCVAVRPVWVSVLQEIVRRAGEAGVDFTVAGGASISLQGVRLPVKDLDLEMSASDVYRFQSIFFDHVVEPVSYKEDSQYRSHFGKLDFEGVLVEISGDLERREGETWKPTRTLTRTTVNLDGVLVPVSWLEEETLAYIRRGRIERAALCLQKCDHGKLLRLLRREEPLGVI